MRDRLIELHEEAWHCWDGYLDENHETGKIPYKTYDEYIADYLLANGVIVPPCKVGDFVYAKFSATNDIECYVINKVSHNGSNYFDFDAHLENEDGYVVDILEFDLVDIGITVFLTEEEAEQALSKLQASYEQVKGGAE